MITVLRKRAKNPKKADESLEHSAHGAIEVPTVST
jgi:hypothetical protein